MVEEFRSCGQIMFAATEIFQSKKSLARLASIITQRRSLLNRNLGSNPQLINTDRTTQFDFLGGGAHRATIIAWHCFHFHFGFGSAVHRLAYTSHIPGHSRPRRQVSGSGFWHSSPPLGQSSKDVVENLEEAYKAETHAQAQKASSVGNESNHRNFLKEIAMIRISVLFY